MKKIAIIYLLLLFIISTLAFYTGFIVGGKKEEQQHPPQQVEVKNVHKDIEETISKLNIKFENIVKAQIILESGNLTSIRAIRDNNIVGMKVAKQRPTTAINEKGHAIYSSIEDCLIDYALWQSQNAFKCRTEEQYLKLLGRIYAEDTKYVEKLKRIIEKQKKQN
jgi:flagellum-specific peptidoglycan hydrolase FlgJ